MTMPAFRTITYTRDKFGMVLRVRRDRVNDYGQLLTPERFVRAMTYLAERWVRRHPRDLMGVGRVMPRANGDFHDRLVAACWCWCFRDVDAADRDTLAQYIDVAQGDEIRFARLLDG